MLDHQSPVVQVFPQHGIQMLIGANGLVVDPLSRTAAADFVQELLHRSQISFTQ